MPIHEVMPQVLQQLQQHRRLVLEAPPGAGKTTQVPLALLNEDWCAGKKILLLEPRRVAARAAATFMAKQLGEQPGQTVGYRIRFESRVSPATRIEVITEGILTRMLQDDPSMDGVAAIVFDEFHERHLQADLALALSLDVQNQLRDDLRLLVMSATLDGEALAKFLNCPRISSAGRSYPVAIEHFASIRDERITAQTRRAIEHACVSNDGDVLVFLPGIREISQLHETLSGRLDSAQFEVLALHGELPVERQSAVLNPSVEHKRRIVLATNVAESSVTLPGVRVVIDAGFAREPRLDPNSGFSRLETVRISQASADQRAGRAGRVAAGTCYRLWPESLRLEPARGAEINQTDLAGLLLELAAWGSNDLEFFSAPPRGALAAAQDLLQRIQALAADGRITERGNQILRLGTHPRFAAMLLGPERDAQRALACDVLALLEARDPLRERNDNFYVRWSALAQFREGKSVRDAHVSSLRQIDQSAAQWRRRLQLKTEAPKAAAAHELGALLAYAFPDRIAMQHPSDPLRYNLSNGRMAKLFPDSALFAEPWLVISELRYQAKDAEILRAAPVDERALEAEYPDRFIEADFALWDERKKSLSALRQKRFDQIVIWSKPAGKVDSKMAAQALTEAVARLGLAVLPWTEKLEQLRTRMQCLREWMPELNLPDVSDTYLLEHLDHWLKPAFVGCSRLDQLTEEALRNALLNQLDWSARQKLDQYAPVEIEVPSGLHRSIRYAVDAPPVLAVKLQELFGLAKTPRIANDRVPLMLHLLSPGGKPLQVTQDLESFWHNTYAEVRKEMKGRYPKHPWPEDPWSATATHRAKPRGT